MIELGLSGFGQCQSGADWCRCFVAFMVHVEDTAARHAKRTEAQQENSQATYARAAAVSTHGARDSHRGSFANGRGEASKRGRSCSCADHSFFGKGRCTASKRGRHASWIQDGLRDVFSTKPGVETRKERVQ